jgi:hypothetical protein
MSTAAVSPLRLRMIEDMNARKLGAHSQRSHIYSCKRFAAFLRRSPRYGHGRGHSSVPAAPGRDRDEHLQSQPDQ